MRPTQIHLSWPETYPRRPSTLRATQVAWHMLNAARRSPETMNLLHTLHASLATFASCARRSSCNCRRSAFAAFRSTFAACRESFAIPPAMPAPNASPTEYFRRVMIADRHSLHRTMREPFRAAPHNDRCSSFASRRSPLAVPRETSDARPAPNASSTEMFRAVPRETFRPCCST